MHPPPPPWYLASHIAGTYLNSCCTDNSASVPINSIKGYSYQYAHTGNAYIFTDYVNGTDRLYIQVILLDSLRKGKYYYAEHYVNSPNSQKLACNNVAMLFTDTPVYSDPNRLTFNLIPASPQIVNYGNPVIADTLNWIKVSGIFKAKGGERYLTLGNFKDNPNTKTVQFLPTGYNAAGYYIDDVSVIPLDSMPLKADAGKDSTIHIGDSVFIGTYTNGIDTIKWQILNTNTTIDSLRPGFWVHPLVNTCYVLTQTVNGYASSDTVCITVQPLPLTFLKYEVRFTSETSNGINEKQVTSNWVTANEINVSHFNIQRSLNGNNFITTGKVTAQNKSTNEYNFTDEQIPKDQNLKTIYYRIESVDFDGRKQYSEIKSVDHRLWTVNGISVYPNPAKDFVNVSCTGMKELKVIDELGQTVIHQITSNTTHKLNVSSLRKGVYVLSIYTAKGEAKNEKLIIQ